MCIFAYYSIAVLLWHFATSGLDVLAVWVQHGAGTVAGRVQKNSSLILWGCKGFRAPTHSNPTVQNKH